MQSKYFSECILPAFVYKYLDFLLVRDFTYYIVVTYYDSYCCLKFERKLYFILEFLG